nr:ATP-binding cassette domain-containing protein [Proteiniborus sp. DW1]
MLGGEKVFIDKWLKSYDVELRSSKHINIIQIIADAITSAIRTVIPISVLLLGAKMVQQDIISIGVLFAFNSVSGAFVDPIISIGQNVSTIVALDVYFKRIKDVINSTPEQVELENNERFVLNSIELRNISYKYNMFGNNIIEDIDMYIERGQSVAFVGLSGSGKSTILKLLLGIYKVSSGKILYNGIDINDMDVRSLRSSAGVVLQESKLFTGTIRDNIVMNRDVTEEELISACKKALIFDDIMNTPLKFDTIVSEQGMNFSGGQRQRILIARALVNNPSMIIFDEATSNLDNLIEKAIYENLNELDCIKIIVAHRLSTIKNVDKIVCIHNSRVVEVGNHDELMSRKGFYYYLYENEEKNK